MLLIAAGTHSADGLGCPAHRIVPTIWLMDPPASGGSITARNMSPATGPALTGNGGLATCEGRLGGQSPITIIRLSSTAPF